MSPPKPPRPFDRDACPPKSATPPRGYAVSELAVPHEVPDEVTGNYEGDELRSYRGRRPTPERLTRLESFKDDMLERFPKVEANVEFLVDAEKERRKRAEESRKWWRDLALKVAGGVFSGTVIVAVLRACGVL